MFRFRSLWPALLLMVAAAHAETLPDYQPPAYRQVCAMTEVLDAPGGRRIGQVPAGTRVTIGDLRFDGSGRDYLRITDGALQGFAAVDRMAHFCDFGQRQNAGAPRFLAPPNSCHVIVASRRTIPEVQTYARENSAYLPLMSVFQSVNGWYAISIGPISLKAVGQVLGPGSPLPDDAYCTTGANYVGILDRRGDVFDALSPTPPDDQTERWRWNCQNGKTADCLNYTRAAWDSRPHDDALIAELTRFDLLGCMGGLPLHCEELIKPELGGWIEKAASISQQEDANFPPRMEPELGKVSCDAGRLDGCLYLGRPELQFKTGDRAEYLTALQAYLQMCRQVRGWVCAELVQLIGMKAEVVGSPFAPDDQYALAQILTPTCARDADQGVCSRAYAGYAAFLNGADNRGAPPDENRLATAFAALSDGCAAGNVTACVAISNQRSRADAATRRRAAAKAIALCQQPGADAPGCSDLASTLPADLPETAGPALARYEEYAEACRTVSTRYASDACNSALHAYRQAKAAADMSVAEKLLRENCRSDRIAGCAALARLFEPREAGAEGATTADPGQPEQRLAALQKGCKAGAQAMGNCASLGYLQEQRGDFAAASAAYALGCTSAMFIRDPSYQGDQACFWGGEHAMRNTRDYATARRYLTFICDSDDWEMTPSACTSLGKMEAAGQGAPVNAAAAMAQFERACFHDRAETWDGEGCLLYGQLIVANRDRLDWNDIPYGVTIAAPGHKTPPEITAYGLSRASHAFLRACRQTDGADQQPACAANWALLTAWSRGDYPRLPRTCRVQNAAGRVISEKPCQYFVFHVLEFDDDGQAGLYVWPDGDRTVTRDSKGKRYLNGAEVGGHSVENGWECWTNAASGNRFCADQPEEAGEY
ncbi:hypothetical protein [Paracoccus sp. S1E-3]|uniref:hypothetical protein n=1 Tax=Paracoccus sp. S1E-3 TaxID=2756130 RepID=UPI0015EE9E96|nr:hypothetical protein [Paracoccus sp. S1E-3]MBA4489376.1 hypothetical protein [Paracoccus sp. S1E-3]